MTLAFAPLERHIHHNTSNPIDPKFSCHLVSNIWVAEVLGINPQTVIRWRQEDRVPRKSADHAAIHLGVHPSYIWDNWFEDIDIDTHQLEDAFA